MDRQHVVLSVLMMEVMMDGWVFTYDFLGFRRMVEKSWCGERWVGRQSWVYVSVIGDCSR